MSLDEKKRAKAEAKIRKKQAKAELKAGLAREAPQAAGGARSESAGPSGAVRFAETVRGVLFVVLAVSLAVAVVLSDRGVIISLEDIFESLVAVWTGRILLLVIAAAFFLYGLKYLRAIR